ncbi:MAG: hypothetical protein ABL963_11085 [Longimicrobiales bacterium]
MTNVRRTRLLALALAGALFAPLASACGQEAGARRLDTSRPLGYFIAPGAADSGYREGDDGLARAALEAWAALADPPLRLAPAAEVDAVVRVYWVPAGGGLYGEMRARTVAGRPAADVFVHPDIDALGAEIAAMARTDPLFRDTVVYLTCVHELGHAFGLAHTSAFADIMYSFQYGGDIVEYFMRFRRQLATRDDILTTSPFSAADAERIRALYR